MTISTNRIDLVKFVIVTNSNPLVQPSKIKDGWACVSLYHGLEEDRELYKRVFKGKGFYETGETIKEVHFSLKNISAEAIIKAGVTMSLPVLKRTPVEENASVVEIIEATEPDGFNIYVVKSGSNSMFVRAKSLEEIEEVVEQIPVRLKRNALQWYKWVPEAKLKIVEDLPVYHFPNGLTVRFVIEDGTFCQTGWQGEYVDHFTPEHFYLWLERFF